LLEDAVVVELAGIILGHNVLQTGTHVLCHTETRLEMIGAMSECTW
jgi:hypothetical protein